jgi:hypothetical protein
LVKYFISPLRSDSYHYQGNEHPTLWLSFNSVRFTIQQISD